MNFIHSIRLGWAVAAMCAALLALFPACGPSNDNGNTNNLANNNSNGNSNTYVCAGDEDGDTICDEHEGKELLTDTDGDGVPDYLDLDSDNDGIADSVEKGTGVYPVDSDMDGIPDFRDLDSDANGIPDSVDGAADIDADGIGNYADTDDDGDGILDTTEIGPDPANPVDTDGDGTPDYQDVDSDGDSILDLHEGGGGTADHDMDGIPNYRDLDSDNDGIPDSIEAGDANPNTPPIDSDGDSNPDYRDVDSDNDGLTDGAEDPNHNGVVDPGETDPRNEDTDGDGVSDMVEVAAGTDPQDPNANPQAEGNFVFLVPFEDVASPPEDRLDFSTAFQNVDIYFMIDYSGSMAGEITSIHNSIASVIDALVCSPGEDPSVSNCIPDLQTGAGQYGGQGGVDPDLEHLKDINGINLIADGPNSTEANLPTSAPGWGNEYHLQAMEMAISGSCASDPTRFGLACYRSNSLRILLMATDEPFTQDPVWPGSAQPIMDLLYNNNIVVIGVYGASAGTLLSDMASMSSGNPPEPLIPVLTTTSINTTACNALPAGAFYNNQAIVEGVNANAANAVTCAVQAVTAFVAQDVRAEALNDPANVDGNNDPVDAPAEFIDYIEVFMDGSPECPNYTTVSDSNLDGHPDVFEALLPGNPVCWKIHVKDNYTVEPAAYPLMFRATIEVYGTGNSLLDSRDVYFLVPPVIEGPGVPQ
ncbi:MAG: hypothetical protein ABI333_15390 [bacterium]